MKAARKKPLVKRGSWPLFRGLLRKSLPLWGPLSGKWGDNSLVLQASQDVYEVLGRKGMCRAFCPAPPGGVRVRTMMMVILH